LNKSGIVVVSFFKVDNSLFASAEAEAFWEFKVTNILGISAVINTLGVASEVVDSMVSYEFSEFFVEFHSFFVVFLNSRSNGLDEFSFSIFEVILNIFHGLLEVVSNSIQLFIGVSGPFRGTSTLL